MTPRPPCPECGQDWIRCYRFKDDGSPIFLCTECDSLWWSERSVGVERPAFVDDVVAARLNIVGNPWDNLVWADVMAPASESN